MSTYLGTPEGRAMAELVFRDEPGVPLEPPEVTWQRVRLLIEGQEIIFEVCYIDGNWWAAIGRVPGTIITIDSRGVPLRDLQLERIPRFFVPALPDLGEHRDEVVQNLEIRFTRVPFGRIRGWADYWALRDVEIDHVERLAHELNLSIQDRHAIQAHWWARIDEKLSEKIERLQFKDMDAINNSRIARRLRGNNLLYQLWSNTVGPGTRSWFGNRYATVRRYTLRLYWRP